MHILDRNLGRLIIKVRDQLIHEGLASIQEVFEGAELEGSIEGLEACRTLSIRGDYERAIAEQHKICEALFLTQARSDVYWRARYKGIQIEYVYDRLNVIWAFAEDGEPGSPFNR